MTNVAILKADSVNPSLQNRFGDIDLMMQTMLENVAPGRFQFETFDVQSEQFPRDVDKFECYLITGSRSGVYESDLWIAKLLDFIREIYRRDKQMVGICFGHQVIAEALGGEVKRFQGGWSVGLQTYLSEVPSEKPYHMSLLACHQDQVLRLPENAKRTLSNSFCVNAGFRIGDQVLTVQPHPEFTPHYLECVLRSMEAKLGDQFESAVASLQQDNDSTHQARLLAEFLLAKQPLERVPATTT